MFLKFVLFVTHPEVVSLLFFGQLFNLRFRLVEGFGRVQEILFRGFIGELVDTELEIRFSTFASLVYLLCFFELSG